MKPTIGSLFLILLILIGTSNAHEITSKVFCAGFAFIGEYKDIQHQYKYSNKIYDLKNSNGDLLVEQELKKRIAKIQCKELQIISNNIEDLNTGEGLSMAIALDWEDVATEKLEERLIKSVYNLHGQVLIFDFVKKEIVACYPFGVRITDCTKNEPNEAHKLKIFKKLYLADIDGVSFLGALCELLENMEIKPRLSCLNFKVEDVILEQKAKNFIPTYFANKQKQTFKTFIAQQFSSFFVKNLNTGILPYTKDHAIGNKMAGRFSNGDIFEFKIPKSDYPVTITLRGFKKAKLDENETGQSWVYGSYIRLSIASPLGEIVNSKIKHGSVKIVPKGQEDMADGSAFLESLLSLFNKTTQQIDASDSSWLKKCAEGNATRNQFKTLKQKIHTY